MGRAVFALSNFFCNSVGHATPSWVTVDDVVFMIGLSLSISAGILHYHSDLLFILTHCDVMKLQCIF